MKKVLLSSFVIFSFFLYALNIRARGTAATLPDPSGSLTGNFPSANSVPAVSQVPSGSFRDGTYTGPSIDAYYGNVQVQLTVSGGRITAVQFLDYPHDRSTSRMINSQAVPLLQSEVIIAQSGNVDIVTGATATSEAFLQSLQPALAQAKG